MESLGAVFGNSHLQRLFLFCFFGFNSVFSFFLPSGSQLNAAKFQNNLIGKEVEATESLHPISAGMSGNLPLLIYC